MVETGVVPVSKIPLMADKLNAKQFKLAAEFKSAKNATQFKQAADFKEAMNSSTLRSRVEAEESD